MKIIFTNKEQIRCEHYDRKDLFVFFKDALKNPKSKIIGTHYQIIDGKKDASAVARGSQIHKLLLKEIIDNI